MCARSELPQPAPAAAQANAQAATSSSAAAEASCDLDTLAQCAGSVYEEPNDSVSVIRQPMSVRKGHDTATCTSNTSRRSEVSETTIILQALSLPA
jgi:hypothetical protein